MVAPYFYDWQDLRGRMQQYDQNEALHPIDIIRQELYNKTLEQALAAGQQQMEQTQQLFPGQLKAQELGLRGGEQALRGGEQSLTAGEQAIAQEKANAPPRNFANLVGTLGGQVGADAFVKQYPKDAQNMFGASSVPMRGAQGTLNEVAADQGRLLYNTGPEVARQLNLAGGMFPLQMQMAREGWQNQKDLANIYGGYNLRAATAGRGEQADWHKKQVMGGILTSFNSSAPVSAGVPAFIEAVNQHNVSDPNVGNTLMRQGHSLIAQVENMGKVLMQQADALGVPEMKAQLQAMMDIQLSQLRTAMNKLESRYGAGWQEERKKMEEPKGPSVPGLPFGQWNEGFGG